MWAARVPSKILPAPEAQATDIEAMLCRSRELRSVCLWLHRIASRHDRLARNFLSAVHFTAEITF